MFMELKENGICAKICAPTTMGYPLKATSFKNKLHLYAKTKASDIPLITGSTFKCEIKLLLIILFSTIIVGNFIYRLVLRQLENP